MIVSTAMQNIDLLLDSYDYDLPHNLIADRPAESREKSRLLVYYAKSDRLENRFFYELPDILPAKHLLVLNQSKVFPCRLFGSKVTGGKCELFLLSLLDTEGTYPVLIKSRGRKSIGDKFCFGKLQASIVKIEIDGSFMVEFNFPKETLLDFLNEQGNVPIPPYIRGGVADEKDLEDYQTVFAKDEGSVAAPTAGLHFTDKIFDQLKLRGIQKSFVTLHVGAGTFKPVTSENILDHKMHTESFMIDEDSRALINSNHNRIAVGTTSLRALESSINRDNHVPKFDDFSDTDIFLYPGKEVRSIKGLITNFHLPKSTLLMLVSSIVGREKTLEIYKHAVDNQYRFFSYGDAMLILRDL